MTMSITSERLHREMLQKSHIHDAFFGLKNNPNSSRRPNSTATEFVDTDWDHEEENEEEDIILSDIEDEEEHSPRDSINSSGQRSVTTLSSYEEIQTPRSSRAREAFTFDVIRPVEGPRGPHLFRSSTTSSNSLEFENALSLSPLTPKVLKKSPNDFIFPWDEVRTLQHQQGAEFQYTTDKLDVTRLVTWTPEMVAQWMLGAGIELLIADKFVENDVNGGIVLTMKFEDLRELGIQSFGVRTKLWEQIHVLRGSPPCSPRPATPIDDKPSREVKLERKKDKKKPDDPAKPRRHRSKKGSREDLISPLESVSIVGIEQLLPKPHKCSKGENCSKYRRYQRMMEAFKKDHPFVSEQNGVIMIAGDPGNPDTAQSLEQAETPKAPPNAILDSFRPTSDAIPSFVASSDVMGPGGLPPWQYLQEATLKTVETQDPQDNVRQFLAFQQQAVTSGEVPPTPPFQISADTALSSHPALRTLPRLSIPPRTPGPGPSKLSQEPFVPYQMDKAEPLSPDLQLPIIPSRSLYRFGTPFSDMDVPMTAIPLGPISRETSQSVPPDMNYRSPTTSGPSSSSLARSQSRASTRRPSFPVMPPLNEDSTPKSPAPPAVKPVDLRQQALQAPPRKLYPWSGRLPGSDMARDDSSITFHGPMRKRKTRLLRHEWNEAYFTLRGTRLAMHQSPYDLEKSLEYIDIDDYAIACSGLASSKLNAAFKAVNIALGKDKNKYDDTRAFSFQLVPQDKNGVRLRKRESSSVFGSNGSSSSQFMAATAAVDGINTTGKAHHFAVRSRDERIDWMRELMLAKALKQKGEGYSINVNGSMI